MFKDIQFLRYQIFNKSQQKKNKKLKLKKLNKIFLNKKLIS